MAGGTFDSVIRVLMATGAVGSFFTLLAIFVRQRVPLRRIKEESDVSLRDSLMERIEKLETDGADREKQWREELRNEREECEERVRKVEDRYADRIKSLEAQVEGLHRQIIMRSSVEAVQLNPSENVKQAAERVAGYVMQAMDRKDREHDDDMAGRRLEDRRADDS